jgi:CubicO group peptidase (beta-lactamase class C family)
MKLILTSLYALLILLVAPRVSPAQTIQTKGIPNPAVSAERLKRIDTLMQSYIDKDWVKGVVTLIVKDNQVVQYKAYGYADAETKKPMTTDAIFRIMSQTKAITSVGIMILYEHGKITLDEPIADFIPEFRHPMVISKYNAADTTFTNVPARREITFRDLLTHTSGLDYNDIGTRMGNAIYTKAGVPSGLGYFDAGLLDKMKILAKQPLMFQPGEKWQYSLGTDLLGCLIEVISGQTLEEFFHKQIFAPLGMKDSYFNVPAGKGNRLASVYTEDNQHQVIKWSHTNKNIDPDYPLMNKKYFSGGAGLSSTAFDYAIFMQMMLNGGIYNGHRILSPRTVQLMTSNQLDFTFNGTNNFGLGFELTSTKSANRSPRSEGSFGWGGYFGSTYFADPKTHMVYIYMIQQTPNSHADLEQKLEQLVYSSFIK